MLHEVFYWLFNMSIAATAAGLIVLLLRTFKKLPRRIAVMLWLIPFLRMTVPVGLGYKYSLMSLLSRFTSKTVVIYKPVVIYHPSEQVDFSMTNHTMAANSYFPITYKVDLLDDIFRVGAVIWCVVCLSVLLTLCILYFVTLREIKDAACDRGRIYYSTKVTMPAVYGVLRPKILLPASYRGKDVRYILCHEEAHIKRADNLWRILGFVAAAIHWFNPLAWVFLKCFLSDLELACDEHVLAKLGDDEIKDYALSLVNSRESAELFVSAFGGAKIRTRIEHILSFQKMTTLSFLGFLALLVAIFTVLLTNAT